jgi:hypothetical protein
MAPGRRTWVQRPHSRQASGLCAVTPPPLAANTPAGHICRQAPQPTQRPESTATRAVAPLSAEAFPPLALLVPPLPVLPPPAPESCESDPWPESSAPAGPFQPTSSVGACFPDRSRRPLAAPVFSAAFESLQLAGGYDVRRAGLRFAISCGGCGGGRYRHVHFAASARRRDAPRALLIAPRDAARHVREPAHVEDGVDAYPGGHDRAAPVVDRPSERGADAEDHRLAAGKAHRSRGEQPHDAGDGAARSMLAGHSEDSPGIGRSPAKAGAQM